MQETTAQIATIGLGRMGKGIARRLLKANIPTVVWNRSPVPREELAMEGAMVVEHAHDVLDKLTGPRVVWSMLPAGEVTEDFLLGKDGFINHLSQGDIMIDGGNANYKDSVRRAKVFKEKAIHYLDIGTSGGLVGETEGYCLMVGGEKQAFDHVEPLLKHIAQDQGYGYVGPSGAGHFVKMVHNAIEYGMMQAIGEGLDLIKKGPYNNVDLPSLLNVWNHGSIVESFLGRTIQKELEADPNLDKYTGEIGYTGEAKWAIEEAEQLGVDFQVIRNSIEARYKSPQTKSFGNKVVAALRHGFGGHTNKERS